LKKKGVVLGKIWVSQAGHGPCSTTCISLWPGDGFGHSQWPNPKMIFFFFFFGLMGGWPWEWVGHPKLAVWVAESTSRLNRSGRARHPYFFKFFFNVFNFLMFLIFLVSFFFFLKKLLFKKEFNEA
jgi:hypothetical protein